MSKNVNWRLVPKETALQTQAVYEWLAEVTDIIKEAMMNHPFKGVGSKATRMMTDAQFDMEMRNVERALDVRVPPLERLALCQEMAQVWQAVGVRILETMYVKPTGPIPQGRFVDSVINACNQTMIRVLRHHGITQCTECGRAIKLPDTKCDDGCRAMHEEMFRARQMNLIPPDPPGAWKDGGKEWEEDPNGR